MTKAKKRKISIIVPVFNEERNVRLAYDAISAVFEGLKKSYDFEIVFTDNHSTDGTFRELSTLAGEDSRVRVIRFARNFGFQRSVLTGYRHALGDAAIQMDCDLQDSPEMFKDFLKLWEEGHDVVVGVRRKREEEGALLTAMRRLFYKILDSISDDNIMRDGGDFRLVDRSILDQLKTLQTAQPYMRALTSSLAAHQIGVPYDRTARQFEQSKFPLRRLIGFAFDGIFGHSTLPLKLATYVGITISFITLFLSGFYILSNLMFGQAWPSGFATTTVLILFGIGLNGIFMGILGEYISRIYRQVHPMPTTIVETMINVDQGNDQTS